MRHAFRVVLVPKPLDSTGKGNAKDKAKRALATEGGEAPGDEAVAVDDLGASGQKRSVLHVKALGSAQKANVINKLKAELQDMAESFEYHACRHDEDPPQPCGPWEVV